MAKKIDFKRVRADAKKGARMARSLKGATDFNFGANVRGGKRRRGFGGGS
jgi:hypothetical protein